MATSEKSSKSWIVAFVLALFAAAAGWGMFWTNSQQNEQISTKLGKEQGRLLSIQSEVERTRGVLTTLTTEKNKIQQHVAELESAKAHLLVRLTTLDSTKNKLTARVASMTGELQQVQQRLSEAMQQKIAANKLQKALEVRLKILSKKYQDLTALMQSITAERDRSLARNNDLQGQLSTLTQQQEALLQQKTALQHKQEVLRQQAEAIKQHQAKLTKQLAATTLEKEQLAVQVKKVALEKEQITKQMKNASRAKKLMTEQLQTITLEKDQLTTQLARSTETIKQLQNQNRDLLETRDLAQELQNRVAQLRTERARFQASLAEVKTRLKETLDSSNVKISQLKNNTTAIRLGGDITFALASAELTDKGKAALDLIAQALNAFPSRLISVEGHTDPLPLRNPKSGRYPSNWELSAARAASAVRYLISRKVDPKRLRVVGYSAYRSLTSKVEEYARNRRIVILLLPLSGEQITKRIPVSP